MTRFPSKTRIFCRLRPLLAATVAAALLISVPVGNAAGAAPGDETEDLQTEAAGAASVFTLIADAWVKGDQEALSRLVHPDGLTVAIGGTGDRSAQYSPSQAYYFFRNLFQSYRTLSFSFLRVQDAQQGQRVHGLAAWKRRRPSSENVKEEKLVFVLVRHEDRLLLSEITTIK